MTPEQIVEVRPRLLEFAGQMFAGALPRSDQRIKGELYLRGLLTDGRRKSMQPMAERLGADYQGLQQFVTSSTWDFEAVRANREVRQHIPAVFTADGGTNDPGFGLSRFDFDSRYNRTGTIQDDSLNL